MNLHDLVEGVDVKKIVGSNIDVKDICCNTNEVKEGSLFFCIEGYKTDGHKYAEKAVDNGAKAIVIDKDVEVNGDVTKIYVDDTRIAMAKMSSNFFSNPSKNLSIIGITGTSGKTTSTYMLKSILEKYNKKTALLGSINNIIGNKSVKSKNTTPESLDLQRMFKEMADEGVKNCVMEVSSHSIALNRVYGIHFDSGVFTNLSQDHLDFHKTMENYFQTKLKLFDNCSHAVINIDDEYGKRAVKLIKNDIITFGLSNDADVRADNIELTQNGSTFDLNYKDEKVKINILLPGKYNIYNALSCGAAAISIGVPLNIIKEGLEALDKVPGRSEKINTNRGFNIIIDYAHTPGEIENILKTTREYAKKRLVIVFGCGGDRDKTKRPIMGEIAGSLSDFCVVTSDNPRSEEPEKIIEDILPGVKKSGCDYVKITNRKEAIKYAILNAKKDDVIVIAGKGHENYQILKDKTIHFDEREIVQEILKED